MFFACHDSLFESSLFRSGVENTLVFLWLLARCDEEGTVIARPWAVARDLSAADPERFTEDAVRVALENLSAPDLASRSTAEAGRRIVPVSGSAHTWSVVNFLYYQTEWAAERRRVKERSKKRRQRAREEACPPPVPDCPDSSPPKEKEKSESESQGKASKRERVVTPHGSSVTRSARAAPVPSLESYSRDSIASLVRLTGNRATEEEWTQVLADFKRTPAEILNLLEKRKAYADVQRELQDDQTGKALARRLVQRLTSG